MPGKLKNRTAAGAFRIATEAYRSKREEVAAEGMRLAKDLRLAIDAELGKCKTSTESQERSDACRDALAGYESSPLRQFHYRRAREIADRIVGIPAGRASK